MPLEAYAHGDVTPPDTRQPTLEAIRAYLRAHDALTLLGADAIISVLRATHNQLAQRDRDKSRAESAEPHLAAAA